MTFAARIAVFVALGLPLSGPASGAHHPQRNKPTKRTATKASGPKPQDKERSLARELVKTYVLQERLGDKTNAEKLKLLMNVYQFTDDELWPEANKAPRKSSR